jgi:hypothetical protein
VNRRHPAAGAVLALLGLVVLTACGRGGSADRAVASTPALHLEGQRVLVLPLQEALPGFERSAMDEALFEALQARQPRTTWIGPAELRRAVRRSPGFAESPDALPIETLRSPREADVAEALAGPLRRYSALTDARLVLLPLHLRMVGESPQTVPMTVLSAVVIDVRMARVIWRGEGRVEGEPGPASGSDAAAALARRLVAGRDEGP